MLRPKDERRINAKYLAKVRKLPCVACEMEDWDNYETVPHHKTGAGMGCKAHDDESFPLCTPHHTSGGLGIAIHAGVETWEAKYKTEDEFILQTRNRLGYVCEKIITSS